MRGTTPPLLTRGWSVISQINVMGYHSRFLVLADPAQVHDFVTLHRPTPTPTPRKFDRGHPKVLSSWWVTRIQREKISKRQIHSHVRGRSEFSFILFYFILYIIYVRYRGMYSILRTLHTPTGWGPWRSDSMIDRNGGGSELALLIFWRRVCWEETSGLARVHEPYYGGYPVPGGGSTMCASLGWGYLVFGHMYGVLE